MIQRLAAFIADPGGNPAHDLVVLSLLFGIAFFIFLGAAPLLVPDEARYAEIPREMRELGDFITPHLNYVKYFEKPPLHYWLTAFSFAMFGETEFAARFFSALSGLVGVLLTYWIGLNVYGRREGMLSALILGTSIGYLIIGRLNIIDMPLTLFIAGSLGLFLAASKPDAPHPARLLCLAYACAGLAVMTKGLVGIVLPTAIIFLYTLTAGGGRPVGGMRIGPGITIVLLVSAPWFVLVSMRNPEFPGFFFIHEHLGRFFTAQHGRGEPLWYFVPIVLGGMFPWSFFLPAAIMAGIRARRAEPGIFLLIWACVIIIFFSLSGSKLPPYVLPAFPSMALLLGRGFSRAFDRGISLIENQGRALAVSLCVGSAGVAAYGSLTGGASLSRTSSLAIAALLLLGGVIVVRTVRGGNPAALFLGVWLIACTVGSAGPVFARGTLHEKRSLKELALIVRDNAGSAAVYSYGFYAQDLPFYAKRRVGLVGVTSELAFGRAQEKKHSPWFITYRTFYKLWDSGRPTVTMIDGNDMPLLLKSVKSPVRVLGRKGRKELIANR